MVYPKLTPATAAVHDLLTCDVDRQRLNRFDIGYKACRFEKDLHIPVAPSIQSSRTQCKARQCIGPGLPIQLVLEFLGCRREGLPALLRMIDDVLSGFLCCGEKAPDCILIMLGPVGHVDQLVVRWAPFLFKIETTPLDAFDRHLVEFKISVGTDHGIHLARHQRRRQ